MKKVLRSFIQHTGVATDIGGCKKALFVFLMVLFASLSADAGNYYFYTSGKPTASGNENDKAFVGAKVYKVVKHNKNNWVDAVSTDNSGNFELFPYPASELEDHKQDGEWDNKWYKVAETIEYYQKVDGNWTKLDSKPSVNDWDMATVDDDISEISPYENRNYAAVCKNCSYYHVLLQRDVKEWIEYTYTDGESINEGSFTGVYDTPEEVLATTPEEGKWAVALNGGKSYTYTSDKIWEPDSSVAESSWDSATGTLSIGSNETNTITELMAEYGITAADVNKVLFDGGEYDKSTQTLTTSSTNYNDMKNMLVADNNFTVQTISLGEYVTIVDGVTVITNPYNSTTYDNWNPKTTAAERAAIEAATNLKLVGTVGSQAFDKIGSSCTPTSVDLTEAKIDEGTATYTYYYMDEDGNKYAVKSDGIYKIGGNTDENGNVVATETKVDETLEQLGVDQTKPYVYTATVSGGQKLHDNWKKSLTSVSLPTNASFDVLGKDFANGFGALTSVTIPDNIKVIGDNGFYETSSLTSVDLNNVEVFSERAFYKSGLTSVNIPATTTYIGPEAFSENNSLAKVIFDKLADSTADQARTITVKNRAFFNSQQITDVYINTSAKAICENGAFDYYNTWGQGDASRTTTTLHFPVDVADHYANLKHPLTKEIAMDAGLFHNWLVEHYQYAQNPGANGWWEFVNNGTTGGDPDDPNALRGEKFLRTYSDYNYDRIVPPGVKAYIVTGLSETTTMEDITDQKLATEKSYTVNLTQLYVIPKRTGVILYGVPNSKDENGNAILEMPLCEIANGLPLRRDYWAKLEEGHDFIKNYLWPSCVSLDPDGYVEETYTNYELNDDGTVKVVDGEYVISRVNRMVLKEAGATSVVNPWDEQTKYEEFEGDMVEDHPLQLNGFFRNFYLSRYGSTVSGKKYKSENGDKLESDFIGFFRAKKNSSIGTGKAYLRLKSDEFTAANGGEVIINGDTEDYGGSASYGYKNYQVEYKKGDGSPIGPDESGYWKTGVNANPNMQWDIDENWGSRSAVTDKEEGNGAKFVAVTFSGEPEIIETGDGVATMIVRTSEVTSIENDAYYTLQGVRVANPTKGVYVKNGKKVVIK